MKRRIRQIFRSHCIAARQIMHLEPVASLLVRGPDVDRASRP